MIDREQPLNQPGWDAPERKIRRQYVPMREYEEVEAYGYNFAAYAEVEAYGAHDEDLRVVEGYKVYRWSTGETQETIPAKFLDSIFAINGPTWHELIEREICRQAKELPGTAWEVEYEGDDE